ncbi:fungal hydrophobin [Earliella scabrosa]|nr:fungal hydrophobin [Earliella scabrosa]
MANGLPPRAPPSIPETCPASYLLQCCQTVGRPTDGPVALLLSLLGVVIKDPSTPIGLTCSPLASATAGTCTAKTVCCEDNSYSGLIAINCVPAAV